MDELKSIVAENINSLRTSSGLTQTELGEKLNYSDKTISKWERGEALPDAYVLKKLSEIFNVSVDYILSEHTEKEIKIKKPNKITKTLILTVVTVGICTLSLLIFALLMFFCNIKFWMIFAYTVPVLFLVALILNSVWKLDKINIFYISALLWSVLLAIYLTFLQHNLWLIFVLGIPSQVIIILSFLINRKK